MQFVNAAYIEVMKWQFNKYLACLWMLEFQVYLIALHLLYKHGNLENRNPTDARQSWDLLALEEFWLCVCLWKLFLGICAEQSQKREIFQTHFWGFYLASTLRSAPTLWRQRAGHPASVFLIPSDVGKLFASPLYSLTFSISPERLGSLVTVMSNTCGTEQARVNQHTHIERMEDGEGGGQNHTGLSHCVLG